MPEPSIGDRIASYRRRRGLSQITVAGLVGRSESWLSQVERGVREVDSHRVLRDLARVLRVDLDILTGSPQSPAHVDPGHVEHRVLAVERALLFGAVPTPDELRFSVGVAHEDYQAARYDETLDRLPGLIGALSTDATFDLVTAGYAIVAKALTKVGAVDLALLAADRAWTAARHSGDPADLGMAVYQVVCALLPTARTEQAEELAIAIAEQLDHDPHPAVLSVSGALWLIAAVVAARRGDNDEANGRLGRADQQAERLGVDANHRWTAFGPTNVGIHRVSVAAELGDVSGAIDAALVVDLDRLPRGLSGRRTQVQLDLAWAHAQRRRDADALVALLEIERVAPQVARSNAVARDTVRRLLGRARGGATGPAVRGLAERIGVTV